MRKKMIWLVAICICLFLVGCGKKEEEEKLSFTLDVNPSFEIELTGDKVDRITSLNEESDGFVNHDMEGKDLEEFFEDLIEKLKKEGLVEEDGLSVIIGMENVDQKVEDKLKEACNKREVKVSVTIPEITEEAKHEAQGYNVTPAKAAVILEALKANDKYHFDDLKNKSARELNEIKNTGYFCEPEYTLRGEFCEKVIREERAKEGKKCPAGYEEVNGKCYKVGTVKHEPTCGSGYNLKDGKCVGDQKVDAKASCTSGNYNSSTGKCEKSEIAGEGTKSCNNTGFDPQDRMMSNGRCSRGKPMIGDGCEGADSVHDGWCYNPNGDYDANISCSNGQTVKDGKCYKVTTSDPSYSCDKGKLDGNKCLVETSKEPTLKVVCDSGLTSYKDRTCLDYNVTADYITGFTCDKDAVLDGERCIIYERKAANHG